VPAVAVAAAGLVERTSRRTDACVQSLSRAAHMHAVMPLFVEMGLILLSSDETETCARIYTSRHHYIDLKKNVFASSTKF
jgi:hypothetical protein